MPKKIRPRIPLPGKSKERLERLLRFANDNERRAIEAALSPRPGRAQRSPRRTAPRGDLFPHAPSAKQEAFLRLDCREAFYGGAAGGGKSEALLMAALQYVHVPGYAALILRKDTQRLQLAGGLIPRSHAWLAASEAVWNEAKLTWRFPTGKAPATLSFGYLQTAHDKFRYGSSEYQLIAFDELTEFPEEDYLFLFSRLRKTRDIEVPLRMRSASNPGNSGHTWVKNRFVSEEAQRWFDEISASDLDEHAAARSTRGESPGTKDTTAARVFYKDGSAFVPARICDNPAVDENEYRRSLAHLPSVIRQRLMNGDWSVSERGLIRPEWLCRYEADGQLVRLRDRQGVVFASIDDRSCRRFATVDPAGTSADRAEERRGRPPSWSVIQVWDVPQGAELGRFLLLRHVFRERVGFDGLCRALRETYQAWRADPILIENEKLGQAACDVLASSIPIRCVPTQGKDKVARAAPLINKLERGEVFLPRINNDWLGNLESEWLSWTGLPEEVSDQIDAAAYAAMEASSGAGGTVQIENVFWRG